MDALDAKKSQYYCEQCDIKTPSKKDFDKHLLTEKHKEKCKKVG